MLTASHILSVDLNLIQKYNKAGPRYTSYPTAPYFTDTVDKQELIHASKSETGPLSLYFHLPFCHQLCWYCACTKIITKSKEKAERYVEYLEKEMELVQPFIRSSRKVKQIHLGGGTPNFLSPDQIRRLFAAIRKNFQLVDTPEISIEIDLRLMTDEHLLVFKEVGINRASIGIQDSNKQVQESVNRLQENEQNQPWIDKLRRHGMESINIDLICGLPHQTVETFTRTIDDILEYSPDRLAIFSYAHVPQSSPGQKIFDEETFPQTHEKLKILKMYVEKITTSGYTHIGLDHFAKKTDPLAIAQENKTLHRNFQGYSTHANTEICAFGISAIGMTPNTYRQNCKSLKSYYQKLDKNELPVEKGYFLSTDDQIRRSVIMELMCHLTLNFEVLSRQLNINFKQYFSEELQRFKPLEDDGLLEISDSHLTITEQGRLLVRNAAMIFDAYLTQKKVSYSKTI